MKKEKIKSAVESILFISGEPIRISKIAKIIGAEVSEIENVVLKLQGELISANRGIVVIKKEDMIQMATNPENSEIISNLVKSEIQENLSKAALETMSIIAYRGPISRINVEAIRGVNSSFTIRALLMRGLLERNENPKDNRSYLYKISFEFLKKLGLDDISKLPDFETLSKDSRIESITEEN